MFVLLTTVFCRHSLPLISLPFMWSDIPWNIKNAFLNWKMSSRGNYFQIFLSHQPKKTNFIFIVVIFFSKWIEVFFFLQWWKRSNPYCYRQKNNWVRERSTHTQKKIKAQTHKVRTSTPTSAQTHNSQQINTPTHVHVYQYTHKDSTADSFICIFWLIG